MFQKLKGRRAQFLDWEDYRKYAVLAPYLPAAKAFLFEVRSPYLKSQPGEISFPGGQIEAGETPQEAARRETREELLLPAGHRLEVVAPLDIFLAPYNRVVYPFLGILEDYEMTYSPDEVAEVFTVPLEFFQTTAPRIFENTVTIAPPVDKAFNELIGREDYPWYEGHYPVYFYEYDGHVIWGMTARFISNIVSLLAA